MKSPRITYGATQSYIKTVFNEKLLKLNTLFKKKKIPKNNLWSDTIFFVSVQYLISYKSLIY